MPAIVTPERSLAQRMEALERANAVRVARASIKRDLKAGRVTLRQVIADPPECALSMKVYDAIVAAPKLGRVKADRVMQTQRVSPSKTLGGLTVRQRAALLAAFEEPAKPKPKPLRQPAEPKRAIKPEPFLASLDRRVLVTLARRDSGTAVGIAGVTGLPVATVTGRLKSLAVRGLAVLGTPGGHDDGGVWHTTDEGRSALSVR